MAFTLIDNNTARCVRVSLKPEFFINALNSPFVQKRKEGIPPQEIEPNIINPLIEKILNLSDSEFLVIETVKHWDVVKTKGIFDAVACARCGEITFVDKLRVDADGRHLCIPCSGYGQ